MKVTFIIRNLTDYFYDQFNAMADADKFWKLRKMSTGDLRHCVTMKVGTGQFRDSVDLNAIVKRDHSIAFKIEPRRGYKLATFIFT